MVSSVLRGSGSTAYLTGRIVVRGANKTSRWQNNDTRLGCVVLQDLVLNTGQVMHNPDLQYKLKPTLCLR